MKITTKLFHLVFLFCLPIQAAQWYVSKNGLPANSGTISSPWDLGTAFTNAPVAGGDTVWILPGTYSNTIGAVYTITLSGSSSNAPLTYRNYTNGLAKLVGPSWSPDNFVSVWNHELAILNCSNVWVWGLDVSYAMTNRMNGATGDNNPNWMAGDGIYPLNAVNCKLINCVVHDCNDGIDGWASDPWLEISGCISFNNGGQMADRGHGHNFYIQNDTGLSDTSRKLLRANIGFNCFDANAHSYTQSGCVNNIDYIGNILFNAGILCTNYTPATMDNLIMGGYLGHTVSGGNVSSNLFYNGASEFGYAGATNNSLTFNGNWSISNTLVVTYFGSLTSMWNAAAPMAKQTQYLAAGSPTNYLVNSNAYWVLNSGYFQGCPTYGGDLLGGQTVPFQTWKTTGWDRNSFCYSGSPTTNWVWTMPNPYDPAICYVSIINWCKSNTVPVSLSGLVSTGATYSVQNVQDYYGSRVASGTYNGSISFPMTNLAVAAPLSWTSAPPSGPFFAVFVVNSSGASTGGSVLSLVTSNDLAVAISGVQTGAQTNNVVLQGSAVAGTNNSTPGVTLYTVGFGGFPANSAGVLTNDGSGTLGYDSTFAHTNGRVAYSSTSGASTNGSSLADGTVPASAIAANSIGSNQLSSTITSQLGFGGSSQAITLSNANTKITTSSISTASETATNLYFYSAGLYDSANQLAMQISGNMAAANHFIGLGAGQNITSGMYNTADGFYSLNYLTSGNNNTAIGWYSEGFLTNGNGNTAVGYGAMEYGSGIDNVAIGTEALKFSGGNHDVAIGNSALLNDTNGAYNIAIGTQAGTGAGGNFATVNDTYSGFIGVGASRDSSVPISTALQNAWALGYNATVSNKNTLSVGGPAQPMTLMASIIVSTNFTGNGSGITNTAGLSSLLSNWVTSAASGISSNSATNIVSGMLVLSNNLSGSFSGIMTNPAITGASYLGTDANGKIISSSGAFPANASGALTNNGGGTVGYFNSFASKLDATNAATAGTNGLNTALVSAIQSSTNGFGNIPVTVLTAGGTLPDENGANLTSLSGANITAGTVSSNALDAPTKAQLALAGSGSGTSSNAVTNIVAGMAMTNATASSLPGAQLILNPFTGVPEWRGSDVWAFHITGQEAAPGSAYPLIVNTGSGGAVFFGGISSTNFFFVGTYPTNTAGYAVIYSTSICPPTQAAISASVWNSTGDLTNALSRFGYWNVFSTSSTDGIGWMQRDDWSTNWIACVMSNSIGTYFTSTVPRSVTSTRLDIFITNSTSIAFYTNSVLATTITTNYPTGRTSCRLSFASFSTSATDPTSAMNRFNCRGMDWWIRY
jgi:hypothetical protein